MIIFVIVFGYSLVMKYIPSLRLKKIYFSVCRAHSYFNLFCIFFLLLFFYSHLITPFCLHTNLSASESAFLPLSLRVCQLRKVSSKWA